MQQGPVIQGHEVGRILLEHKTEVTDGLIVIPHLGTQQASVKVRLDTCGIKADGIVIVGHRAEVVVNVVLHVGAVDEVAGIARFKHDGAIHVGHGAFKVMARAGSNFGTHDIGRGIVLAQRDALVQVLECGGGIFPGQVHLRQPDVGPVVAAIQLQQALERLLGLVIVLQLGLTHGTVHEHVLVLGHEFEALVIVLKRLLEVAHVLAGHTAHLIGIDDKRVALNSHTRILLSAPVVLQADFGYRAVEVGLCQERLCLNRLVKVLDSKDIILKIERVAPDVHHLVCIDLSP